MTERSALWRPPFRPGFANKDVACKHRWFLRDCGVTHQTVHTGRLTTHQQVAVCRLCGGESLEPWTVKAMPV